MEHTCLNWFPFDSDSQFSVVFNLSGSAERADNANEFVSEEVLAKAMECEDDEAPFYISDEELTQVRKLTFVKDVPE